MTGAHEPTEERPREQHPGPAGGPLARAEQVLDGLPDRPVAEHVAAYDEVHRLLQDALATLDRD